MTGGSWIRRAARRLARAAPALALAACGSGDPPGVGAPRSAVLVTIDTLRADVLGAYGSELGASPGLDRLAQEGVLFEQVQAASPNTLPSHATILTGLRPFRHGVRSNIAYTLAEEQTSLAEVLAAEGYATGAEVAAIVLSRHTGIAQGFDRFRDTESEDVEIPAAPPELSADLAMSRAIRSAEDITGRGIEFLEEHAGEPFFLWLHYYDPHSPYEAPEPWKSRFASEAALAAAGTATSASGLLCLRCYAAEVAYVDAQLERLVEALRRLELRGSTLLVVTSDHGEALGDHDEDTHSYFIYQSTMRVPLLLWGPPAFSGGTRVSVPVRSVDLAPTLLDWLGEPALEGADGRSLVPLVQGKGLDEERLAYGESIELQRVFGVPVLRSLRQGRWKYVHKPRPALFDLEDEPVERRDLSAAHPEQTERLRERLRAMLAEAGPVASASSGEVDPETAAQLAALGYAVDVPAKALGDELESFDAEGPDPTDMLEEVRLITRVDVSEVDPAAEMRRLTELSQRYPDSSPILEKLLDAQLAVGRAEEALATLRRGVGIAPDNERYWANLGELLLKLGRADEARAVLPEILARFPCEETARTNLANLHARAGEHAERIALLEEGLAECEVTPELANELAYALATAPEASLRDGDRALELAGMAAEGLADNPLVLDTLAVAQAESGRQAEARQTLERALSLARGQQLPEAALAVLQEHAAKVAAGEPIRE